MTTASPRPVEGQPTSLDRGRPDFGSSRQKTETGIETGRLDVDARPSRADLIRTAFLQVRACLRFAEEAVSCFMT
jgi:hypothetical protein